MKSIAEYFRDLAADDRYFGAEPPQPDAQMLHQIAEREVNRRVEARVQKNGVVLRQTADAVGAGPQPPERPPQTPRSDDRRPSVAKADPGDNTPFEVDIDGDSVAAKLSRIRAVVARARANRDADTAFAEDEPVEAYLDDTVAPAGDDAPLAEDLDDFASEAATGDDSEPPVSLADMLTDDAIDEEAAIAQEAEEAAAAEEARIAKEAEEAAAAEEARVAKEAKEAVAAEEARIAKETEEAAAEEEARIAREAEDAAAAEEARIAKEAEEAAAAEEARIAREAEEAAAAEEARIAKEAEEAAAEEEARIAKEAEEAAAEEEARVAREAEEAAAAEEARIAKEAEEAAAEEEARVAKEAEEAAAEEEARVAKEAEEADAARLAAPVAMPRNPIARVIKLKRTEFEAALAAGDIEEVEDDDLSDDDEGVVAEIEVDGEEEDLSSVTEASDDTMIVETIAAALADDADEHGNVFAESDADDLDDIGEADDSLAEGIRDLIGQTSLDQDDEADLAAELAAVEREAAAATEQAEAEAARAKMRYADPMEDADAEIEAEEAPAEDGDEQALNRLLDETNAKLSETEGSRRRSAIAHLKAAVAATKADRLLKGNRSEPVKDESLNRYRDDLAKVVRPRRPVAAESATGAPVVGRERPADPLAARPAPLVLVSEQRIDKPAEGTARPVVVRPRRVSTQRPAPVATGDGVAETVSFSDFAAERGAEDLPDILEAAVAYSAKYEGQSELSRPQILRRAASLRPDLAESREKGLQSFGQLLRSGRIRKVGAGQFSLAESDQPQSRASGQ